MDFPFCCCRLFGRDPTLRLGLEHVMSDNQKKFKTSRLFRLGIHLGASLIRFGTELWLGMGRRSQHPPIHEHRTPRNYDMRKLGEQDRQYVLQNTLFPFSGFMLVRKLYNNHGPLKTLGNYGSNSCSHLLPTSSLTPIVLTCCIILHLQ